MSKELMNTTEMKEVISKRTACMKVFEHADHRFTAAIYGTPVHYMKDGRWEEIDNRLEAVADVDEEEIADGAANKNSDAETAALQAAEGVSGEAAESVKARSLQGKVTQRQMAVMLPTSQEPSKSVCPTR